MILIHKTRLKDFLTIISKNIASFLVLAVLFGAAVAMYCGGVWTCKTEKKIFQTALEKDQIAFAEYSFPYGTGDSDIKDITGDNADLKAEGFNTSYCFYVYNSKRFQAKVMSLMEDINQFQTIEGVLPSKDGEIAVRRLWANQNGLMVGDTITLTEKNTDLNKLKSNTFTVTALVETARYPGLDDMYGTSPSDALPINCTMFVSLDAFDMQNGYSNIAVWSASQNSADIFVDTYKATETQILNEIEPKAQKIYQNGYKKTLEYYSSLPKERQSEIDIQDYGYYVSLKSENTTAIMYDILENIFSNVRTSLTLLFVLVSIFVGYSVISRMVHDHIQLIGMKKANGMNIIEIFSLYFGFCLLALVIGIGIFGVGISFLYEYIMRTAISTALTIPHNILTTNWQTFIEISGILVLFVFAVVFVSVQRVMKMTVTQQLAGEVPVVGKKRFYEKLHSWKKLGLLTKTIINNFFNDKRRVVGTVLGIMGSAMLIIASFTFANLVLNSYNEHFDKYYHFDSLVRFLPGDEGEKETEDTLKQLNCDYSPAFIDKFYLESDDGRQVVANLYVYYNEESFSNLFTLKTSNNNDFSRGIFFSFALEKNYNLSTGSIIKAKGFTGQETNVKIDGFFVDYLFEATGICDIETYEKLFGSRPTPNSFFVNTHGKLELVNNELMENDTFVSIIDYLKTSEKAFLLIKLVLMAMKLVFLSVAIIMASIVLWNLINVFIIEKKRDLIMLMINGYNVSFAKKYIYSDTIFLVIVGLIFGSIFGEILGNYISQSFASASCRYMTGIDWLGILYGILIICAITLIICFFALKKIKKFKLSDLNT